MLFFSKIATIKPYELEEKLSEDPVIIDVREVHEFNSGHIPGAKNIPLGQIPHYEADPNEKNQPIYVICHSGMRSRQAVQVLERKGLDVVSVAGGMSQWTGPVKKGR